MKRIGLFLGFAPESGGAFQYAQSILDALVALPADRYEVLVAHTRPVWGDKLTKYKSRIRVLSLRDGIFAAAIGRLLRVGFPVDTWRLLARHVLPLAKQLADARCDLWIFPAQDVWTYAIPVPALGVIHDLMHRYESRFPEVSAFGLYHRRERHYRNLCRKAKGVLVDSEVGTRQVIESYAVPRGRVHVLPFVAPSYMHRVELPRGDEQGYSLPERFIFYPAQFWRHKNHLRLIEAFAIAFRSVPDLHLVLVGSPKNAYRDVVRRVTELGLKDHVHLLGYVPEQDLPRLYRQARALIFPTFFGPTNIPPLEAMVVGCPMAVSRIYAMPDQIGDAALFFDPASVDEIAEAIVRLATDDELCRRLGEAGRAQALKWDQSAFNKRLQSILESVLEQ